MLGVLKILGILYIISFGMLYVFATKNTIPIVMPGDIFTRKAGRNLYIPTGGALIITLVLFFILSLIRGKVLGS